MSSKKVHNKKNSKYKKINSLVPKNLNLNKFIVKPTDVIEGTKKKIGNFYINFKKEREKEKKKIR